MHLRLTSYLAALAMLFYWLAPAPAHAQVLKGTFAAGYSHALSIHADGTLWATGNNTYGQLGDGTTTSRSSWQQVGTATNWVQVAANYEYSLGLRADGTLWAWGVNADGQLGRSTNNYTSVANATPLQVPGTYVQVAAGFAHALGLRADGTLWAWGSNEYGQLGTSTNAGTFLPNPVPTQVPGTYAQLATGRNHCLGLRADGSLWVWGSNKYGTLGTATNSGTTAPNPVPTQVAGTYTKVAAGLDHTLALRPDGSLWAWGDNVCGELGTYAGTGSSAANPVPIQVPGTYTSVGAGLHFNLALQADGSLWAWGLNDWGQLATTLHNGTIIANPLPTQIPGTYVQVAPGFQTSLALRADGSLWAWGNNQQGQLGTATNAGTLGASPVPTATGTALPTRSTSGGSSFGLAIKGDGTLWAWGDNEYGQLGIGVAPGTRRPTQVGTARDWVQVVAGSLHSLALKADGTTWAWGYNGEGQLGLGTTASQYTPALVSAPALVSLAAGNAHSLGLTATGQAYAWGSNATGQLGTGTAVGTNKLVPTAVPGGLQFASLAAGRDHSLALKATGLLYVWGSNQHGQRGDGFAATTNQPDPAGNPVPLVQLAAGQYHSLGRTATGQVYAWGLNSSGQTGNSTFTTTPAPTLVPGLPLVRQVAAGAAHGLALTAAGTIYTWGANGTGQLAQNSFAAAPAPAPIQEITGNTGWAQLASSSKGNFSLVRTASGLNFASAGDNSTGQLGDGTTTNWPRFDRISPLTSLQPLPVLAAVGSASFSLAPNPARTQATAVGLPAGTTLAVYDALGRRVATGVGFALGVAGLPAGLYLVRATAPGQPTRTARLLVE